MFKINHYDAYHKFPINFFKSRYWLLKKNNRINLNRIKLNVFSLRKKQCIFSLKLKRKSWELR